MPRSTTRFATMRPSTTFGMPNREASRMTQEPISAANDIAGDRDEADQRVEADLDRRPGHGHELVEHPRDAPDALLGRSKSFRT